MIGSFEFYGFGPIIFACAVALAGSVTALIPMLIHFVFRVKGASWPAASPRFRVFLSAGTLVILNIALALAWLFFSRSASTEYLIWVDSIVLYIWLPLSGLAFLLLYLSLRFLIPPMNATTIGWLILMTWAFLSGVISFLVASIFVCLFVLMAVNQP